jgi:hypothetical protein
MQAPQKLAASTPSFFCELHSKKVNLHVKIINFDFHLFSDSILILHKMALAEKYLELTLILQYGKSHLLP